MASVDHHPAAVEGVVTTRMMIDVEGAHATVVVEMTAIVLVTMAVVSAPTIEVLAMVTTVHIVLRDMEEDATIMDPGVLIVMPPRDGMIVTDREMTIVPAIILRVKVEVRVAMEKLLQETHMDPETVITPKMIGTPVVESVH